MASGKFDGVGVVGPDELDLVGERFLQPFPAALRIAVFDDCVFGAHGVCFSVIIYFNAKLFFPMVIFDIKVLCENTISCALPRCDNREINIILLEFSDEFTNSQSHRRPFVFGVDGFHGVCSVTGFTNMENCGIVENYFGLFQ